MTVELCPKCRAVTNMKVTEKKSTKKNADKKIVPIKIITYHCQQCSTFVKSEEIEE